MRRDPKNLLTAALLGTTVLLGSAACGSDSASTTASNSSRSRTTDTGVTPPPTDAGQTPAATTLLKPVVLVLGGGIAGVNDRIEVQPDGTFTVVSKGKAPRQGKLDDRQLTAIVQRVAEADLPALAGLPPVTATVSQSDLLTYVLTADGATVKATETTLPGAVQPLVAELRTLLSVPAPTP